MALDFKIDREPKGILCIPYTIVAPNTTPGKGRISFGPTKFVDNITKINIHKTTNLDVDLEGLLEVSTSGVVTIYDRTNPDIYVIFKYSSITDQGNFVEFIIDGSTNLSTSKRQPFQEGTQVCILFTGRAVRCQGWPWPRVASVGVVHGPRSQSARTWTFASDCTATLLRRCGCWAPTW